MTVALMVTDEWHDVRNVEHEIEKPSMDAIERAVRALDASTRTLVLLMLENETHMALGGGSGQYIVYITPDNSYFNQLTSDAETGADPVVLCVGGQEGQYERRFVVGLDAALRAAQHFAHFGTTDPQQKWTRK
jgi:hypothetical protein